MAYVACDIYDRPLAISLDRSGLLNITCDHIAEIGDEIAKEILDGRRNLSHCFNDPPAVPDISKLPNLYSLQYTNRYPAMMPDQDADTLAILAASIPDDAVAVEVGSRFGGSAKIICDHASRLRRIYCIDGAWDMRCDNDPQCLNMLHIFDIDGSLTYRQYASSLLATYTSIVRFLPMHSPYDLSWWSESVDFIFEDSSHTNPQLRHNLDFWWSHLKPGGLMVGHDFSQYWPDVTSEIPSFASEKGLDFHTQGTIWWISKQ